MSFITNGYQLEDNVISKETASLASIEFNMLRDIYFLNSGVDLNNNEFHNDTLVTKCFSWYGAYCFESLLLYLKPTVEKITGKRLHPTYSYARIYYNDAEMRLHKDKPSCQYSASMTIEVDETGPWEMWMENLDASYTPVSISVGSILVYRGDRLNHFREKYKGKKQIQVILHYVDADGEYAENIYDGRKLLGMEKV